MTIATYDEAFAIQELIKDLEFKILGIDETVVKLEDLKTKGDIIKIEIISSKYNGSNFRSHIGIEELLTAELASRKRFEKGIRELKKKFELL